MPEDGRKIASRLSFALLLHVSRKLSLRLLVVKWASVCLCNMHVLRCPN